MSKLKQTVFALRHTLTGEDADLFLTWTAPSDFGISKPCLEISNTGTSTITDEIEENVRLWYQTLGKPVPASDMKWIELWRKEEEKEAAYWKKILTREIVETVSAPSKPVYGTPEFWKDYWVRKKAKEAEQQNKSSSSKK